MMSSVRINPTVKPGWLARNIAIESLQKAFRSRWVKDSCGYLSHNIFICTVLIYHTIKKTLVGKKLRRIWRITAFCQVFANSHNFQYIPFANGLQFAKVVFAKLPTVLIHQIFLSLKFLLYGNRLFSLFYVLMFSEARL